MRQRSNHRGLATLGVLLMLGWAAAGTSRAESISYSLLFCENLDVLKDPTNQTLIKNVSKQSQHSLMMQRTTPYFELRNTSEAALLTEFSMTIGDTAKNFDWASLIEASPGVSFTLETVDSVMGGLKADLLTIKFTSFETGDFVRFRMGLSDDDPGAPFVQDYRTILLGLNESDPTDNAIVTVDFTSGQASEQLVNQLPNVSMNGKSTAVNMAFPSGPCFDHVVPFNFDADGTIDPDPGPPVPEPGSMVLLGLGMLGLVGWRIRRKR